ncbi:MAG: Gfo/Idh/MocA family oxidoreductase [Pirellulales bacterium]
MSEASPLRIGIAGTQFMGRAHSNAWLQAPRFFNLPRPIELRAACGRNRTAAEEFARRWGWQSVETDWRALVTRADIDVIDVSVPQALHAAVAIAAAEAGKHVFCEKPLALTRADAEAMLVAVRGSRVCHCVNHNYRRVPAIQLAKQLIDEGRIGRIFHWRATYQQDWIIDPEFPLTWHLQREHAGSGPHGDLNSHSVDLAHFLVGRIESVSCLTAGFIDERPLPGARAATFSAGTNADPAARGRVTVEDASLMHVRFANGAIGSFEATRFAAGRKNRNCFEIYGSDGSLAFDLERMNELEFYSRHDPEHIRGFRTILVTEACHPYVGSWWPPGHTIGYEHTVVHTVADFVTAIHTGGAMHPDFSDGLRVIAVLEAALESAASDRQITVLPILSSDGDSS